MKVHDHTMGGELEILTAGRWAWRLTLTAEHFNVLTLIAEHAEVLILTAEPGNVLTLTAKHADVLILTAEPDNVLTLTAGQQEKSCKEM